MRYTWYSRRSTKVVRNSELALFFLAGVGLLILPLLILVDHQQLTTTTFAAGPIPGDVNRDGRVNLDDVAKIREDIVNGVYDKNADLNQDGKVDSRDVQYFYDILSLKK